MANENVNKVEYGGEVLIDLTEDSVTPETLLESVTAHDKSGARITGTFNIGAMAVLYTLPQTLTSAQKAQARANIGAAAEGSGGGGGGTYGVTATVLNGVLYLKQDTVISPELTEEHKAQIVTDVLASLPTWNGGSF